MKTHTNSILKCEDGVLYIGEFKGKLRHGKGCSYYGLFPDVKQYDGYWENNVKSGYGIEYNLYGIKVFEGSFSNDKRNGFGKVYSTLDLSTYYLWFEGNFINNKIEGTGKFYNPNGQIIYEGELLDGEPHGNGKLIGFFDDNKEFCEFDISDNVLHVGDIYDGEFIDGSKSGKGRLIKSNGDIYIGNFQNGLYHGVGILTLSNGIIQSGTWENGILKTKADESPIMPKDGAGIR